MDYCGTFHSNFPPTPTPGKLLCPFLPVWLVLEFEQQSFSPTPTPNPPFFSLSTPLSMRRFKCGNSASPVWLLPEFLLPCNLLRKPLPSCYALPPPQPTPFPSLRLLALHPSADHDLDHLAPTSVDMICCAGYVRDSTDLTRANTC